MKKFLQKTLFILVVIFMIITPIVLSYSYKKSKSGQPIEISDMELDITEEMRLDAEIKKIEETVEKVESMKPVSLGEFKLTAYCACSTCCGQWAGSPTASGVMPRDNHTIAVDTSVIPFGTKVIINGNTYVAEDTGSAIKGNRIDIYMSSHDAALQFGVKYAEVFKEKQ